MIIRKINPGFKNIIILVLISLISVSVINAAEPAQKYDFGGMFGSSEVPSESYNANPDRFTGWKWPYKNPATEAYSCPQGYIKAKFKGSQHDKSSWFCYREHEEGREQALDFVGMYAGSGGEHYNNVVTGKLTCPSGYYRQKISGGDYGNWFLDKPLIFCYKEHEDNIDEGKELWFGGMYSQDNVNHITGEKSCPSGYKTKKVLGGDTCVAGLCWSEKGAFDANVWYCYAEAEESAEEEQETQSCDNSQRIMKLNNASGALGALWNGDYGYDICYNKIFGTNYNGDNVHECDNNKVLGLFHDTNSHAEIPSLNTDIDVCYGDLECVARDNTCEFDNGEEMSLALYDEDNSHITDANYMPEGMISWWRFDKGDARDCLYCEGNNGIIENGEIVDSKIGRALNVDAGDYVDIPQDDSLDITDEITIEGWIKRDASTGKNDAGFIWDSLVNRWKIREPYKQGAFWLGLTNHPFKDSNPDVVVPHLKIKTNVEPPVSKAFYISGDEDDIIKLGEWHHLVGTYDGSMIRLYLDGKLINSMSASGKIQTPQDVNVRIVTSENGGNLRGEVDEVAIYNKALTPKEIEHRYNMGVYEKKICCKQAEDECETDGDCNNDITGDNYCIDNNVYYNLTEFYCNNGECENKTSQIFVKECLYDCVDGKCEDECCNDSECSDDYFEDKYCDDNDIYGTFHDFFCNNGICEENIFYNSIVEDCGDDECDLWEDNYCIGNDVYKNRTCTERGCDNAECTESEYIDEMLVEECDDVCIEGKCENITCYDNSDCGLNICTEADKYCDELELRHILTTYTCKNPGTEESYCTADINDSKIGDCIYGCSDGKCIAI